MEEWGDVMMIASMFLWSFHYNNKIFVRASTWKIQIYQHQHSSRHGTSQSFHGWAVLPHHHENRGGLSPPPTTWVAR